MQWDATSNGGFSESEETYFPVNSDGVYGYQQVNVAAQEDDAESHLWAMRFLLKARNRHAALRTGSMEVIAVDNPAILAYWRLDGSVEGKERLLCLFNLSNQQQSIALELTSYHGYSLIDLLTSGQSFIVTEWPVVINLSGYSSHWFRLEK